MDLDRGHAEIHLGNMREIPLGARRIDFGKLLDSNQVFEQIKSGRQSDATSARVRQASAGLEVSTGLALDGRTEKLTSTNTTTGKTSGSTGQTQSNTTGVDDGKDSSESSSSTNSTTGSEGSTSSTRGTEGTETYSRPAAAIAPSTRLTLPAPATSALSASYHSLLYATAETILAGQALQSLFNIDAVPEGDLLVSMPVILTIQPGRSTRDNYVVDTKIELWNFKDCGIKQARLLAVAPLGLTNFATSSTLAANALQLSASAGIPVAAALAQLKGGLTREDVDSLNEIGRRPEFQVGLEDWQVEYKGQSSPAATIHIRYLGTENLRGGVRLRPTTMNAEILMLVSTNKPDTDHCEKHFVDVMPHESSTAKVAAIQKGLLPLTEVHGSQAEIDLGLSAVGLIRGAMLAGVTSTFEPTEENEGWTLDDRYTIGSYRTLFLDSFTKPLVKVDALTQLPGGILLVSLSEADKDSAWTLCASILGKTGVEKIDPYQHKEKDGRVSSLRMQLKTPLEKDGFAMVAIRPGTDWNCDSPPPDSNWASYSVKVLGEPKEPEDDKVVKLTSVQASLESDAVVVRIEYTAKTSEITVQLNGSVVTPRSNEPQLDKTGKVTGGVAYVALHQSLRRDRDPDRRIRVDLTAKGYKGASTEVRATW